MRRKERVIKVGVEMPCVDVATVFKCSQDKFETTNKTEMKAHLVNEHAFSKSDAEEALCDAVDQAFSLLSSERKVKAKDVEKQSVDDLANELVKFIEEEFPEGQDMDYLPSEVTELFWEKKGIPDRYLVSAALRVKIQRVEKKAKTVIQERLSQIKDERVPTVLKKSIQQIAADILYFAEKRIKDTDFSSEDISFREIFDEYKSKLGIEGPLSYELYTGPFSKLFSAKDRVRSKIESLLQKERIRQEKDLVGSLLPQFLSWLSQKGARKVSRPELDLFIMEKGIIFPSTRVTALKTLLYQKAKSEYKTKV